MDKWHQVSCSCYKSDRMFFKSNVSIKKNGEIYILCGTLIDKQYYIYISWLYYYSYYSLVSRI